MPRYFKNIPLDYLLALLNNSTKEYNNAVSNKENEIRIQFRKEEVEIIQTAIVAKRLEFPPPN